MSEGQKVFEQFFVRLKRRRMLKRTFVLLRRLLFSLIFLFLLIWGLLQFPGIQNYIVQKVTTYLSSELNTNVYLKRIDIEFFDKLVLEEFYLEDQNGDTLLYSKELKANFKTNLLELFSKELQVDNIYLSNARFNLVRDSSAAYNNLKFISDFFKSDTPKKKKSKKKSKPFLLHVNGVYLNDVVFNQDDKVKGLYFSTYVKEGEVLLENLDLPNNRIDIKSIVLTKPIVTVQEKEKFPVIKKVDPVLVEEKMVSGDTSSTEEIITLVDSINLPKPFIATIGHFSMLDGNFDYDHFRQSPVRTKPPEILDFKHLNVFDINIDIDSFQYSEGVFKGAVNRIALEEKSGFVLNQLSAKDATVSDNIMELNDMKLITPNSNLGDTLVMRYNEFTDFRDFENKVKMTGKFNNAEIAIQDIIVFAPVLGRNKFFKNNEKEVVKIDGQITGSVNKLRGKDLLLQIAGNTIIRGDFSTRDLSIKGEEFLALKLDLFKSNIKTMRLLVPGFNAPENFDKLGRLNFSGRFDGFFNDFVAFGELSTALGRAELDMHMNLRQGRALAQYAGKLSLFNFDLKEWSGNNNLGNISFVSEVKEGVGLTLETVNATLSGKIQEFTFKEYTYNNVTLDGELTKNKFDGKLVSLDQNIDFVFNGRIELADSIPEFNFDAKINHFDLQALNLSKKPLVLEGDVELDFINFDLSEIAGEGDFYNFKIINALDTFTVDTLIVDSEIDSFQRRSFVVESDVVEMKMEGYFDIQEVPGLFGQYLVKNFPEFSDRFNIKANNKELKDSQFDFELRIPNSKNLLQLIDPQLDTIRYAYVKGRMNNMIDSVKITVEIPEIKFGKMKFDDILFKYEGLKDKSDVLLDIYHSSINNDKQHFEPLKLEGSLTKDTFSFDITSTNFTTVFDDLNLKGKFFLVDEFFQVQFLPSNLVILQDQWDIVKNNYIRFGKGYVETKNFDLRNFEKRIVVESIEGTGLTMSLENFDLSIIDDWWVYDKLDFSGKFFVLLEVGNIYNFENIFATSISDSMKINGDYFGELRVDVAMESIQDQVDAYISIDNQEQSLKGEGFVAPFSKKRKIPFVEDFDFKFQLKNYPLEIVEYFIPNGISNTVGMLDSDLRLYGKLNEPKIMGEAFVRDIGVTIDYLQTRYTAPVGKLKINNEFLFDASENVIYDALGNIAQITGGIRHTGLNSLRLDVSMKSDKFLFLDTDKNDNDIYYGYAIGKGKVEFSGSFQKTDITINATTGKGSKLNIPINYNQDASEVKFITFIEKDSIDSDVNKSKSDLRGVEIDMNLEVTPDAAVWLIFDERAGDIIKGTGTGNLQLQVFRNGDIKMYGDYEIEKGEYLFTLVNLVNKPFVVKKGGTIKWEGDPFGAILDIEASYDGLNTSVYNFIIEYLNTDLSKSEAKSPTDVDLTMLLSGPMLQPEINFDIGFPNLTGEIKNYTDSKLRLVRQDQNELNRQVFGLLVIGGFLPNQNSGIQGTQGIIGINNTVSELLTNQLSIYLTEILSDVFTDVNFISGVDFTINYNIYEAEQDVLNKNIQLYGTEIELGTKFDLFNDRFSLDVAGSYVDQGGQYFSGDLVLEYFITKNRRLKARFYRLSDQTIQGRRDKTGFGLTLRREFNSFSEFVEGMRKSAKKVRDGG
jgi:translocation-and-assembly-module (TAM) inner membrane subunit TamB-like protein